MKKLLLLLITPLVIISCAQRTPDPASPNYDVTTSAADIDIDRITEVLTAEGYTRSDNASHNTILFKNNLNTIAIKTDNAGNPLYISLPELEDPESVKMIAERFQNDIQFVQRNSCNAAITKSFKVSILQRRYYYLTQEAFEQTRTFFESNGFVGDRSSRKYTDYFGGNIGGECSVLNNIKVIPAYDGVLVRFNLYSNDAASLNSEYVALRDNLEQTLTDINPSYYILKE